MTAIIAFFLDKETQIPSGNVSNAPIMLTIFAGRILFASKDCVTLHFSNLIWQKIDALRWAVQTCQDKNETVSGSGQQKFDSE